MRRSLFYMLSVASFLTALIAVVTLAPTGGHLRKGEEERGTSDAMSALNDWTRARAYPGNDIPPDKYFRAFLDSKLKLKEQRRGVYDESMWQPIGPQDGDSRGRAISVAVNPVNTSTVYCGTASGG